MTKRFALAAALLFLVIPSIAVAKDRFLQGRVVQVGEHDELMPLVGADVVLLESGDSTRTKHGGRFRLFLKDIFKAGVKVTLSIERKDWRIQYPLDGETRIPDDLDREGVEVRLLPVGSKKFWSADRIEKFIRDTAERSKEQVRSQGKPQEIDFSRYIKDWALTYGFTALQAKEEIDKWVAEAEKKNDPYQLGLAAYAKKNFAEAGRLFEESAAGKVRTAQEASTTAQRLTEEAIRDFVLAGNSHTSNYQFELALAAFQKATRLVSREAQPRLWAGLTVAIGSTSRQIGIRAEGDNIHRNLNAAVEAYQSALTIFVKDQSPQPWAMTQNNLGNVLWDLGTRTEGEASTLLLAEAVDAYRQALTVRTKSRFPQDWATTQNDLGNVFSEQGMRTVGEVSLNHLAQAVEAYKAALTIFTKKQNPHLWAVAQNNLGNVLAYQGEHTRGEADMRLLAQAAASYREVLTIYTKGQFPQEWATTQSNLGAVLQKQGAFTRGNAGMRLLAQAVDAYREVLTVSTKMQFPQQWAGVQNNLGNALRTQANRIQGEAGTQLLTEAVIAYRNALTIFTKAQLPQDWAMTQTNLGIALYSKGIRIVEPYGTLLLIEAVTAYRAALAVYTPTYLPEAWGRTQSYLADTYLALNDWSGAAASYRILLSLFPDDEQSFFAATFLLQERLFAFQEAFELTNDWMKRHPDDIVVKANLAVACFTTSRFDDSEKLLNDVVTLVKSNTHSIQLMALKVIVLVALNKHGAIPRAISALELAIAKQPKDFRIGWNFEGTRHFIKNEQILAPNREWISQFVSAVEDKDRDSILASLRKIQAAPMPPNNSQ